MRGEDRERGMVVGGGGGGVRGVVLLYKSNLNMAPLPLGQRPTHPQAPWPAVGAVGASDGLGTE